MNENLISLLKASKAHALDWRENLRSRCLRSHESMQAFYAVCDHVQVLEDTINLMEAANLNLASSPQEAHSPSKMGDRDNEMCHLHSAIHGLQVELVRTTGDLRSLLLVLSKLDLGIESKINMKISELSGGLNEVKASTLKALSEIRNRIDAADVRIVTLEKQLADSDIPAEAETALAELKTISKQLDDIVPDVPDLPPVPTPAPTPA